MGENMKYIVLIFTALVLFCGCGKGVVPITGTVTLDGSAIEDCRVLFIPKAEGTASAGVTDKEGKFLLETLETKQRKGILPGGYTATFAWNSPDGMDEYSTIKQPYDIPRHYSMEGIPVEITREGDKHFNFELSSK